MFDLDDTETLLLRFDTAFWFIVTSIFLVNFDLIPYCGWYWCFSIVYLIFEAGDDALEVDLSSGQYEVGNIPLMVELPYNSDLINQDDLYLALETGFEKVALDKEKEKNLDPIVIKYRTKVSKLIKHKIKINDRLHYITENRKGKPKPLILSKEEVNVLQFKLKRSGGFDKDKADAQKGKLFFNARAQWETFEVKKDLFLYTEFLIKVNNYLFETQLANGIVPDQMYDFKVFCGYITKPINCAGFLLLNKKLCKNVNVKNKKLY